MLSVQVKLNQANSKSPESPIHKQGGRLILRRFALFFALMVTGLAIDLWTKSLLFGLFFDPVSDGYQEPYWLIDGVFGFQCSTNPGALFGIGKGHSALFAVFSLIALTGVFVWLFVFKAAYDRWLTFALGLISGGILGNLYDRIGWGWLPGYPESIRTNVRDWILFRLDGVPFFDPWPNFNVADMLLVTGAIMLFIHAVFWAEPATTDKESAKNDIESAANKKVEAVNE